MICTEKIPQTIAAMIDGKDYRSDGIGRSDSQILLFDDVALKIEKITENALGEYRNLALLQDKLPVPQILAREEADGYQYLLMTKLRGNMACADGYDPKTVTIGLANGLKTLWQVPLAEDFRRNTLADQLAEAKKRLDSGYFDDKTPDTAEFRDFSALYEYLYQNRPEETLVFSHGDYCLPNIFLDGERVTGFLDLGGGGIADRWVDITMCLWSMKYNFCEFLGMPESEFPEYQSLLFERLCLAEDTEKLRYYRLLDLFWE